MLYLVTLHSYNNMDYDMSWESDEVVGVFDSTKSAEAAIMNQYTKVVNNANKNYGYTLSKSIEKTIGDDEETMFEFEIEAYMETITHQYLIQSIEINRVLNTTKSEEE